MKYPKKLYNIIPLLFGITVAYISFHTTIEMMAFSSLIFLAYFFIQKRSYLFFFILGYHLMASYGILFGIFNFYISGYILGFFSWIFVAFITSLPWILIWSQNINKRMFLFPLVILSTILPPLGFIDGNDPIVSAGVFFPGMGYIGILLYFTLLYLIVWFGICYMSNWKKWIFSIIILLLLILGNPITRSYNQSNFITPLQTEYSFLHCNKKRNIRRQKELFYKIQKNRADTFLLPEHIFGTFTEKQMHLWKRLSPSKTVLAGAYIYTKESKKYNNVLLSITHKGYNILYIQRVPVPLSMWIPFYQTGANATITASRLVTFKNKKLGVLICYEQYLPYIYLQTMWYQPDYLVAIANLWWSNTPIISKIQKAYLILWSRLFAIPYFYSLNH